MVARAAVIAVALLALLLIPAAAQAGPLACTGDATTPQRVDLTVHGEDAYGIFVAPTAQPTAAVIMAHGFSFNAEGWRDHARRVARQTGALAIAMNYRGLKDLGDDPTDNYVYPRSRGYAVKKGGEDLVAAGLEALRLCPAIKTVALVGISMGGNAAGLALANAAHRPDGAPLFDYFVGIEGVYDLRTLYQLARIGSPISEFVQHARDDIEAEAGGTPEQVPDAYTERTVVARDADIAKAPPRGVVLVHGLEDGLAVYPQVEQFTAELRQRGIPTDLYRVVSRGPTDDPDTTLTGYVSLKTGLAGHGPEVSTNHIVINTGFARLKALLVDGAPPPCNHDFTVNGSPAPSIRPDPDTTCPRGPVLSKPGPAAPAAPVCGAPRLINLKARRHGADVVVSGKVIRSCSGPLTLKAGQRKLTRRVGGRFSFRVRSPRAKTLTVIVRDAHGASRRVVRVRQSSATGISRSAWVSTS